MAVACKSPQVIGLCKDRKKEKNDVQLISAPPHKGEFCSGFGGVGGVRGKKERSK